MSVPFGAADRMYPAGLETLAGELAKHIKSEQDITALSRQLLKLTVESALKAELDEHLGYERHAPAGRGSGNSRNGYSGKTLKGDLGEVPIQAPRDRNGTFEPQLIVKGQTRLARLDSQILAFYAKGMTTRDIADTLQELYGTEVSPALVAKVTDAVWDTVQAWQNRPLETVYPILYLDGLVIKVHQDNRVINKTMHVALGVNLALAYAGSVVDVQALQTLRFRLFTCIKVSDSVTDGISYFYAEVQRLKALLDDLAITDDLPLFFAIDEIFRGTNNRERLIGSRAYIRALVGQRGIGLISTHDLELIRLEEEMAGVTNYHFRDDIVEGRMVFDYQLRRGPSPTTNALRIMAIEGLPVEGGGN